MLNLKIAKICAFLSGLITVFVTAFAFAWLDVHAHHNRRPTSTYRLIKSVLNIMLPLLCFASIACYLVPDVLLDLVHPKFCQAAAKTMMFVSGGYTFLGILAVTLVILVWNYWSKDTDILTAYRHARGHHRHAISYLYKRRRNDAVFGTLLIIVTLGFGAYIDQDYSASQSLIEQYDQKIIAQKNQQEQDHKKGIKIEGPAPRPVTYHHI